MGTTLTGTTPQDTYDSLIKVTDNGPLSGSLKTLTDGLGNDSALALSTGAASITGTLAVSSNGLFGGSTNAGNAGTNTISVGVAGTSTGGLQLWAGSAQTHYVQFGDGTTGAQPYAGYIGYNHTADSLIFGSATADRLTITSAGNVGIGQSAPDDYTSVGANNLVIGNATGSRGLTISTGSSSFGNVAFADGTAALDQYRGLIQYGHTDNTMNFFVNATERFRITANGVTFNGDTAAANALDDYEEGTFTPTFAGGLTGVTYSTRYGSYTKIGNRVMFDIRIQASAVSGSSGNLLIGGLPFATNGNVISNATIGYFGVYTTDIVYCLIDTNTTNAILFYKKDATPLLGSELTADTSAIHLSGVYFV